MADIEQAALLGYAQTQDQSMLNQTGIATPIRGPGGIALAAIQCSVSSHIWSAERIQTEILPYIIEAENGIAPHIRDGHFFGAAGR